MLQTCDVGCCVEWEDGVLPLMLDVVININFNVADVEFCRHLMLSWRRRERAPDIECCTHGRERKRCREKKFAEKQDG
jgi:hypothetical protein